MEFNQYLASELKKLNGPLKIQVCDDSGVKTKWINIPHTTAELLELLAPKPAPKLLHFTRVNNDGNGNPRFVVHYTQIKCGSYEEALKIGRKIGGGKFHNKQYGGGIVFSSYNLTSQVDAINKITGQNYTGYNID